MRPAPRSVCLFLLLAPLVTAQTCTEANLVHQYEFDSATLLEDSISPGSGDGLPVNSPQPHTNAAECVGGVGGCLYLDNQDIQNGHGFDLPGVSVQDYSDGYTLSFWAKRFSDPPEIDLWAPINALATLQDSISPRYGTEFNWMIAASKGGAERYELFSMLGSQALGMLDASDSSPVPSEWIHYTIVEHRSSEFIPNPAGLNLPSVPVELRSLAVYLNGALAQTYSNNGNPISYWDAPAFPICLFKELITPDSPCKWYANETRISIGYSPVSPNEVSSEDTFSFHGLIDDVRFYNCPLSADDIAIMANNTRVCSTAEAAAASCSEHAFCERVGGVPTCTCKPGFADESDGAGTSCVDIKECRQEPSVCHFQSYCDETPGSFVCSCPEGYWGDGISCTSSAWAIRTVITLKEPLTNAVEVESIKLGYAEVWYPYGANSLRDAFLHSMHVEVDTDTKRQVTLNALFETREQAIAVKDAGILEWSRVSEDFDSVDDGPEVYRWSGAGTGDPLQIRPTGLTVDSVMFQPACMSSGCWKIEVTYSIGLDNFNVFFIPRAEGSDALSYDYDYDTNAHANFSYTPADTFVPNVHPCTSAAYDGNLALPAYVTPCCIPAFNALYRTVSTFEPALDAAMGLTDPDGICFPGGGFARDRTINGSTLPRFARAIDADDVDGVTVFARPDGGAAGPKNVFVDGTFSGMTESRVRPAGTVDKYVGIYKAILELDEVELRNLAGQLRGTVGVEHTIDTFVGLADFSVTGGVVLDTFATQVSIHLEKTSFFSVSTHGTNDYTFLEYVNMRLVAVYKQDSDFSGLDEADQRTVRTDPTGAAHYVQVTFTLGSKYGVNTNGGLIPLASVRAGKGTFFSDELLSHKCLEYTGVDGATFDDLAMFQSRFVPSVVGAGGDASQDCAPEAAMCVSPIAIPDSFVSFNIPLGVDWLPEESPRLDQNVFVHLIVSAVDTAARAASSNPNAGEAPWQMKTTLAASVPVVRGGVNVFCDAFVAKTTLKDVANADIIVGSASSIEELTRLRIIEDVASTALQQVGSAEVSSASIESGLMTLVLKGNSSYFNQPGTTGYSLELEDVITIHLMESQEENDDSLKEVEVEKLLNAPAEDNDDANGLDVNGYLLNGAFRFSVDTINNRAHLEPTTALLSWCPFNPPRPMTDNMEIETCVTRRDVQFRGYPARPGGSSSAMELRPDDAAHWTGDLSETDEAKFMFTILGGSDLAAQLAVDFAEAIDATYALNGRYTRAFWINPGYEWTPTQTGARERFSVSQKIYLFALIILDEDSSWHGGKTVAAGATSYDGPAGSQDDGPFFAARRRRMLLQASPEGAGAGLGGAEVVFQTSPTSMMAAAFGVPLEHVAVFRIKMQLTNAAACLGQQEFQAHAKSVLTDLLAETATAVETVQVKSFAVDKGDEQCARRRRMLAPLSSATADLEMLIVFKNSGSTPSIDVAAFGDQEGIIAVEAVTVSSVIKTDGLGTQEAAEEGGGGLGVGVIAGAAVGGVVLLAVVAVVLMKMRGPQTEQAVEWTGGGPNLMDLDIKAQLQNELGTVKDGKEEL